jgi:hypothetical protein
VINDEEKERLTNTASSEEGIVSEQENNLDDKIKKLNFNCKKKIF